ncbi:hypothetical protein [Oceaniglobus ichthyenteri]|uniref:hypothetical protein n=1 Tax=Oceaniglobus ichthyenteri TaxID=2136177 RepID=UPI000D37FADE|nr:hypothetical protein [Oceaniglobus ichthyenteri]
MGKYGLAFVVAGSCALFAVPALAGGRLTGTCPAGYAVTYDNRGAASCRLIRPVNPGSQQHVGEIRSERRRFGVFCPYPHRASDAVFSGGSGYVIKDDVRRANGCL